MKRILLALLAFIFLCGAANAYMLVIDAPDELQAGVPLLVTGNTTFPSGTQFDIILYKVQFTTPEEVARRVIIVDPSKTFSASFATTSLSPGQYKVEVEFVDTLASTKLGSGSTTVRVVDLVDRSNEIFLTVPANQTLPDALRIEGYIPGFGVATLTMDISGPGGLSLQDQYVRTSTELGKDAGIFAKKVNVTEPGNYYVNFYDRKGFITQVVYSVTSPGPATPTPEVTGQATPVPIVTPVIPFPMIGLFGGLVVVGLLAMRRAGP
jgi:hypothetical protein